MSKSSKKRNSYNTDVIEALINKYGFSSQFIRQCIRGDRNSATADIIRKEYKAMITPSQNKIQEFLQKKTR